MFAALAATWACGVVNGRPESNSAIATSRWGTPAAYTTAHRSLGAAVRDFFGMRSEAVQPFAFSHQLHIAKEVACVDCHAGVDKGPVAGLPSVATCMACHSQIATERPLIQTLAALETKGEDVSWQRVYGYTAEAHVRFDHAPHIRAKVECSTCHGDLATQTVATRAKDVSMSFCVNCHKSRQASNDCQTCHY